VLVSDMEVIARGFRSLQKFGIRFLWSTVEI